MCLLSPTPSSQKQVKITDVEIVDENTSSADIIAGLSLKTTDTLFEKRDYSDCSADELEVVNILSESRSRDEVLRMLDKPIAVSQTILAIMEIKGLIEETMGEIHLT